MLTQPDFTNHTAVVHTAVIGGGLAGLTAAATLARAGRQVLLLEKGQHIGGRAMSQTRDGYTFNLGPHALYIGGGGSQILADLDVAWTGSKPNLRGFAVYQGAVRVMPALPPDVLRVDWLAWREKLALLRLLGQMALTSPDPVAEVPVGDWINRQTGSPVLRQFIQTLVRVSTYANMPDQLSTAVFLRQFQLGLRHNVRYLDGGWQTLVDGLRATAVAAGAQVMTGARITVVDEQSDRLTLHMADGRQITAQAAILAVDPRTAARLLPQHDRLQRVAETAVPVRAACLDVVLRRLPHPERNYVLGIDRPLYYSNHSAVARFGPDGGQVVHVAKYLPAAATDPAADEAELEWMLDTVQPGWRQEVMARRFLPRMVVVNQLATAADGGIHGRVGYAVPGSQRLYLAGDWVGPQGWLADASLVSGQRAAELALDQSLTVLQSTPMEPMQTAV